MPLRHAPKRGADWHPADVVAALRKAGWSLRRLSAAHGLHPGTLGHANRQPQPRYERIIARVLGLEPWDIWPSRYERHGDTYRRIDRRRGPRSKSKSTRQRSGRNGSARTVA